MSEKLAKLAKELAALPEPSDPVERAQFDSLKALGAGLASLPQLETELWRKRAMLKKAMEQIETSARIVGDEEGGIVQLLRRMRAISNSVIEGMGEPPD